jgi:hypothetical protein
MVLVLLKQAVQNRIKKRNHKTEGSPKDEIEKQFLKKAVTMSVDRRI